MPLYKPQGVALPDLTNPATAENIQKGFEAITEDGSIVTGTHTEADSPTLPALSKPAAAAQILADYDAINADGNRVAGSMPNNGAVKIELNAGSSVAIAAGYHNGSGYASAKSLAAQTVGDAVAGDLASGKTAWVNGVKVTGSYVVPAPGYQYEEVAMAKASVQYGKTKTITSSFSSIETYASALNSASVSWVSSTHDVFSVSPSGVFTVGFDNTAISKNVGATAAVNGGSIVITAKQSLTIFPLKFLIVGNE